MSTTVRTSNQSRASTKIVIIAVVAAAAVYFGKAAYERNALNGLHFAPAAPGVVNLVGVDTQKGGYHIVVANTLAQLVQSPQGAFENQDANSEQVGSDDSDAEKKRVPLKELLQTMTGKSEAVGRYVAVLNDLKEEDIPAKAIPWSKADLEKAIGGDAKLKTKLEQDLNTHLDGTPLPEFRPSTFDTGIVINVPVTLNVTTADGNKSVSGEVPIPFQSSLMRALKDRIGQQQFDTHQLAGYYGEVGKTVIDNPTRRQNVVDAVKQIISKQNIDSLTKLPQEVLDSIQILANDSMITHASYRAEDTPKGPVYNMDIELTDEGRKRLWQYSRNKVGTQLLFVVDGVAVAAPRVGTELAQSTLTISRLPDERIVKDSVDKINAQSHQNP